MSDIRIVPSPHEGWTRYEFEALNRTWFLLTIERADETTSMLGVAGDNRKDPPWPHFNHHRFPGLMKPEAAIQILQLVHNAYNQGIDGGIAEQQRRTRRVLGL